MLCPTCKTEFSPSETVAMPFCSDRCKLIDLGQWLDEGFSLPQAPDPEADEVPDDNWSQEPSAEPEEEAK